MEEDKKNGKGWWIPLVIVIGIMLLMGILAYLTIDSHPEYQHLKDKLKEKGDVSIDYRRGYLDCIRNLKDYWDSFRNMTFQFSIIKPCH